MEQEKETLIKTLKWKVTPYLSEADISNFQKDSSQNKQLKISVNCYLNLRQIFFSIHEYLSKQSLTTSILFEFFNLKNFEFDNTLCLISDCSRLSKLKLRFGNQIFFDSQSKVSLGECLYSFNHLTSLSLEINLEFLTKKEQSYFCLEHLHKKALLKELKIKINNLIQNNSLIENLLNGVGLLRNLESFKFYLSRVSVTVFPFIKMLRQEMNFHPNLTTFKLLFGDFCKLSSKDYEEVGLILQNLLTIKYLELIFTITNMEQRTTSLGLEQPLLSLESLLHLKLRILEGNVISYEMLLHSISQIQSLESVDLVLKFSKVTHQKKQLKTFGQQLAQIQPLTHLTVYFDYDYDTNLQKLLDFIIQLYPLKKLITLDITTGFDTSDSQNYKNIDEEKLFKILSQLTKFYLYSYNCFDESAHCLDKLLLGLSQASQLQDLQITFSGTQDIVLVLPEANIADLPKNKQNLTKFELYLGKQHQITNDNYQQFFVNLSQVNHSLLDLYLYFNNQMSYDLVFLKSLGENLRKQSQLQHLQLAFSEKNDFDSYGFSFISQAFEVLQKLKFLNVSISKDRIEKKQFCSFLSSLGSLSNLKKLDLSILGSDFENEDAEQQFGSSILLPNKIKELKLTFQMKILKYKNMENLFQEISKLKMIKQLELLIDFIQIEVEDIIAVRKHLSSLKLLENIKNRYSGFTLLYLFNLFTDLPALKDITSKLSYYTSTQMERKVLFTSYPHKNTTGTQIQKLEKYYLTISSKSIFSAKEKDEFNVEIIDFTIQSLSPLYKLSLILTARNCIQTIQLIQIFKSMSDLINLQELKISLQSDNQITTQCILELGNSLLKLKGLKKLALEIKSFNNSIIWSSALELSTCIGELKNLNQLAIIIAFDKREEEFVSSLLINLQLLTNLQSLELKLNKPINIEEYSLLLKALKDNLTYLSLYVDFSLASKQQFQKYYLVLKRLNFLQQKPTQDKIYMKLPRLVVNRDIYY